jgi:hypothetical protein
MKYNYIVSRLTFDIVVAFDTVVALVIPLVFLVASSPVMWCKEYIRTGALTRLKLSPIVLVFIPEMFLPWRLSGSYTY